jgi:hypothetical protein
MAASSPVAIPPPNYKIRGARHFSTDSTRPLRPQVEVSFRYSDCHSFADTSCTESESQDAESQDAESLLSPDSEIADYHHDDPFSPPPSHLRRSSSDNLSLSSSSTSKWTRAFSPPREPVTTNDPLCIFEDPEESDDDSVQKTESGPRPDDSPSYISPKRQPPPARRKSHFKSNLTASLQALRDRLPSSIPSPTLYAPPLVSPRPRSYSLPPLPHTLPMPLSPSLPVFDSLPHEAPASSAVHLQTYSVSLGPPKKPRETRLNSDFFRLLALEMEMRRCGKFVLPSPEPDSPVQGIVVSGKVRRTLPRRSDKERDDINISTFNKSRLKW